MLRNIYVGCALTLVTLLLVPVAQGQYMRYSEPVDSPHWWTLSDSLSPAELRHAILSPSANRERLRKAIDEGRVPAEAEQKLARVELQVDGRVNPELIPMWDAFDAYAMRFDYRRDWESITADQLAEYGLSAQGIQTVIRLAKEHRERLKEIQEQLGPWQRELVEIQLDAQRRIGEERMLAATRSKDFTGLARASSRTPERVKEVYESAQGDPRVIGGLESVVKLHSVLSEDDWDGLRAYLLDQVASLLTVTNFRDER